VTTLSPPPNWYADPSGRHESRYWDGFTWTPHVADRGQPGLDPLVRTDPIAAAAPAAGSRQADPIGPGTEALRSMATVRPEPASDGSTTDPRVAKVAPIRRRGLVFDVTAMLAVIIVFVLGGYVLWRGWDASSSPGRTDARGAVPWKGDGVRVDLPPSWVEQPVPADHAAAVGAFTVIDRATVVALVGTLPITTRTAPDAATLEPLLATTVAPTLAGPGTTVTVIDIGVVRTGGRLLGAVTVDVVATDGSTTRAGAYVVVDATGAATVTLVGPADSVTRHLADARSVAESASLT